MIAVKSNAQVFTDFKCYSAIGTVGGHGAGASSEEMNYADYHWKGGGLGVYFYMTHAIDVTLYDRFLIDSRFYLDDSLYPLEFNLSLNYYLLDWSGSRLIYVQSNICQHEHLL